MRQLRSVERRKFGNPWSGNARIGEAQLEIFKEILLSWRFPKLRVTQIISNHPLFFDHFSIETILIPQLDPPSCYLKGGQSGPGDAGWHLGGVECVVQLS